MIEFALVVPVLALFMMGTLEFGLAFRNKTAIANALRNAARTDANLSGNRDRRAEYFALDQFKTATANLPRISLQKLVVFKTTSSGAFLDSTCNTKSPSAAGNGTTGYCNIYGAAQMNSLVLTKFGSSSTSTTCSTTTDWDGWWCPVTRVNDPGASGGTDYLGIKSVYTYTLITRVLPNSTITMTDTAVIRVEPKVGN